MPACQSFALSTQSLSQAFHRLFLPGLLFGGLLAGFQACKPTDYSAAAPDTLNTRFYCNDPAAVNYNWGFPGRPDNSLCFYPSDAFAGRYNYTDSIYLPDGGLDSAASGRTYVLNLRVLDRQRFSLAGFCAGGDSLRLTATRFFRATIDTTLSNGQLFCRTQDSVLGTLTRTLVDTTRVRIELQIVSDTGRTVHRGTAYRQ
jgi:hypothetical protein